MKFVERCSENILEAREVIEKSMLFASGEIMLEILNEIKGLREDLKKVEKPVKVETPVKAETKQTSRVGRTTKEK